MNTDRKWLVVCVPLRANLRWLARLLKESFVLVEKDADTLLDTLCQGELAVDVHAVLHAGVTGAGVDTERMTTLGLAVNDGLLTHNALLLGWVLGVSHKSDGQTYQGEQKGERDVSHVMYSCGFLS